MGAIKALVQPKRRMVYSEFLTKGHAVVITKQKAMGVHFTPPELARFVARRIINAFSSNAPKHLRVLDPSCGDGELLLAFADMLPKACRARCTLVGIESDRSSLHRASKRLAHLPAKEVELHEGDFLSFCENRKKLPDLFHLSSKCHSPVKPADVIIANPPYVRTQTLGAAKAQKLSRLFGLKGRIDLYQAFLLAMTDHLSLGGMIGVITSNRFLFTKSATVVREFLDRQYHITEIFDLGDTKLFDAAVLPAVFIGQRKSGDEPPDKKLQKFVKIYENLNGNAKSKQNVAHSDSVFKVLESEAIGNYQIQSKCFNISRGFLSIPAPSSEPWRLVTAGESAWLERINARSFYRIGDILNVRVGIKTTADEVFIRENWDALSKTPKPEKKLLQYLLSHGDAARWRSPTGKEALKRVLYTHEEKNGRRQAIDLFEYPKAKAYLSLYRKRLEGRKYVLKAKRNWYEIWVPQNPHLWKLPKIVFPDISLVPKFFYDADGRIVDGNCYWIPLENGVDGDVLFLLQGVANSKLMTRYHDLSFNNKLYAGRRRYLTQYVQKYPLPDPTTRDAQRIVALVKELVFAISDDELQQKKERELEIVVASAFGVKPVSEI